MELHHEPFLVLVQKIRRRNDINAGDGCVVEMSEVVLDEREESS
jgi:hypothetical protein